MGDANTDNLLSSKLLYKFKRMVLMKRLLFGVLLCIIGIVILATMAWSNRIISANSKSESNVTSVTYNVSFNVMDSKFKPLENVKIVILNMDGDVVAVAATDKKGHVEKRLTVPIDKRYAFSDSTGIGPRGTVTAIAFKEGYREQVLFEVPVSAGGSFQETHLNPVVTGERNEPDVQVGSSHHLEIYALVDKYSKYAKE